MKTIVPVENKETGDFSTFGAYYTPGTLTSGSGYAVNKGMKINGSDGTVALNMEFRADVTRQPKAYDKIDRIYGAQVWRGGNWDWLDRGIFRSTEDISYSAYGGIKGQWQLSGYGTTTKYLFLRVASNKIWLDHNLK